MNINTKREYGYKYKDRIWIHIQRLLYGYKYIGSLWIHIQKKNMDTKRRENMDTKRRENMIEVHR